MANNGKAMRQNNLAGDMALRVLVAVLKDCRVELAFKRN
jgi:hypothetical protein